MTNEAVCIETPTKFARYTVMDSIAVPLNTIMKLSGANTAVASTAADGEIFAGIAWEEKTASDGMTEIVTAIDGVWDLVVDGSITNGGNLSLSGANTVKQSIEAETVTGAILGKALETGVHGAASRVRLGAN